MLEKYKSMDSSDVVEDDEEKFMKTPCQDFSWMRPLHKNSDVFTLNSESDSVKSRTVWGSEKMSLGVEDNRKDSCVSAEPMKDDLLSNFQEWTSLSSTKFYPIDQEDWDNRIIWKSPSSADNSVESYELSGPDSGTVPNKETDKNAEVQTSVPEMQSEPRGKDSDKNSDSDKSSISVEPFGSDRYSHSTDRNRSHPQLLRLESELDKNNTNLGCAKDVATEANLRSDATRKFSKLTLQHFSELTLQNRDVVEGSWLDNIIWEPHQSFVKPKLILDLQDKQMLFELSDVKNAKDLQLHAGAMIVERSLHHSSGDSVELHNYGILPAGRFNISNDKFYSNRKSSQQLRSHSKKRTVHGLKVLHSVPALKLQTMKAKLSK